MLKILKTIDLFGKEPDLYYKGHHKKTSWLGFFLTLLYIIIYFAFFIYKFVRMVNKVDVTFYETYAFTGDIPSAVLNKEIFGGGIGLINPKTGENYINERIYVVQSKYRSGVRKEGVWKWEEKPIPLVPCKLEYFGSRYSNIFKEKKLDQLYCFNDVDGLVLQGYSNLNVYSYFDISFYRCVNTTTKHDCLPLEVIDEYLTATQLSVTMQDIDLTPQDYEKPVVEQEKDIPGPLYRDLHQEIYGYLQVTLLETEENIIGFEALSNIKTQMYLKYDHAWVISSPNIYGNYYQEPYGKLTPMTNIRIQLANKVLTLKRFYVQLIDVLGDVGGLMEVIESIFGVMCIFVVDIFVSLQLFLIIKICFLSSDFISISINFSSVSSVASIALSKSIPNILEISYIFVESPDKSEKIEKFIVRFFSFAIKYLFVSKLYIDGLLIDSGLSKLRLFVNLHSSRSLW